MQLEVPWAEHHCVGDGIVRSSFRRTKTPFAREHKMVHYLCINSGFSTWLPTGPGKHGYVSVGNLKGVRGRRLRESIATGDTAVDEEGTPDKRYMCHLFLQTGASEYYYAGLYEFRFADGLTREEWELLPKEVNAADLLKDFEVDIDISQVKTTCLQSECHFANEKKDAGQVNPQELRDKYSSGERSAPCVLLRCVRFDPEVYKALVQENQKHMGIPQNEKPTGANPPKRRRVDDEPKEQPQIRRVPSSGNIDDMYA